MSKQNTLIEKLEQRKQDFEPRKEHSEFVSVDDKLPDERVKVLAWHNRKENFFIATYDRSLKIWLNDGKPYSSEFLYNITHWIPMPSPPSEV